MGGAAAILGRGLALALLLVSSLVRGTSGDVPTDAGRAFDDAARLYEQGQFAEAAAAYGRLATNGVTTAAVWFNQGNAWFKAGRMGRAIASYRHARALAPHDPDIAANLRLARSKVAAAGGVVAGENPAARALAFFTAREWAGVAVVGVWFWFGLLIARQVWPKLRVRTASSVWGLGGVAVVATALALASGLREGGEVVVVDVPQATARFGPLREAESAFTMPEGSEASVTDRKGDWIEVRDAVGRKGWLSLDQVLAMK